MDCYLENLKIADYGKKGNEKCLLFNVYLQLDDADILSVGWRLAQGRIMGPSFRSGPYWLPTFSASTAIWKEVYRVVAAVDFSKYPGVSPPLTIEEAVYSWALSPALVQKFAPKMAKPKEIEETA